ncbi:MAG: AraC family transcriptional regulator [Sporomusaceae bacterium]|nr:AraC family transcriptional regulator [Sporomusaceae bacterium]
MSVDIHRLAGNFSRVTLQIVDVIRVAIPPGKKSFGAFTPPVSGLIFPLKGQARMVFDGVAYEMAPGRVFHGGPNIALDREVVGDAAWNCMIVHYRVDDAARGDFPEAFSHYQLDSGSSPRVNELLQRLHTVSVAPGNLAALQTKSLFFSVLDEILTCAGSRHHGHDRQLAEHAADYITRHYMEPLTVAELARQYGLNSKQFAYLFQKHNGIAPLEYLIEYRMRRARQLLRTTAGPIAEIAACVGYGDPYYFSKLFKKRTGYCPSALRGDAGLRKAF